MKLTVEYLPVEAIKAYERNSRTHSKEQIEQLKKSITEFGFTNPVLLDEDNELIAGHGRMEAARALGMTEVPAIRLKGLTEAQRAALRIADNSLALNAGWDVDALREELKSLKDADFNAAFLGIDALNIDGLDLGELDTPTELVEDEPPEENEVETRVKLGEVWELGDHRLMCGDSTKEEDVARLMAGEEADLWLTDPPYNVAYEGGTAKRLTILNDSMTDVDFRAFLTDAFSVASEHLKQGGVFYIWHADSEGFNFRFALRTTRELQLKQCLIWVKNAIVLGRQDYQWKHEPCLYGWKDGAAHYFVEERNHPTVISFENKMTVDFAKMKKDEMRALLERIFSEATPTSIIREPKPARNAEHPTMKPVRLFGRLIQNSSRAGEIVLDTFGGSGTTIIACEQLGRQARLMELDPHYCDVIIARWERLTGETAHKLSE